MASPFTIVDLGFKVADFVDTAAFIMNLDLVISVNTAVAHLAGALGKPCWILLSDYKCDCNWLTNRSDSPWHPGLMRLFRQKTPGTWKPVIADVQAALAAMANSRA
jgi:ADP-heptose:LPS heptosyltransferase